ncbi:MAG TPA: response regulator [Polyangiales bacterium]
MAKLNVLIVDDDDMVRTHLTRLLSFEEHTVHQLPSAIGVTRAVTQHRIDVVVLDIMMPSLPGDKLTAVLRQNPRFRNLGVVLISSRPVEELEVLAKQVEADAVVTKSEVKGKLNAAVRIAALRHRR